MPTDAEWNAHLKESKERAMALESRDRGLENSILDLTSQIAGLRITVESFANKQAQIRASAQLAQNPPLDGSITHQSLHALSATDAESAIAGLSFWKARSTLVVGFVGALIALGVAFGLPITKEQTGAILAVVTVALALLASMRVQRTTSALVRAGERRGALAGPDSVPRKDL